jgi:hypothetical protein
MNTENKKMEVLANCDLIFLRYIKLTKKNDSQLQLAREEIQERRRMICLSYKYKIIEKNIKYVKKKSLSERSLEI